MKEYLFQDLENIETIFEAVKTESLRYLSNLDTHPTSAVFENLSLSALPENGKGAMAALQYFSKKYAPLIVASGGPRYWGYVVGGATPASIVGDWLATIYDQNPQAIKGEGDISANIELETIQLILDLFDLPKEAFLGGFVTGATMSNFTCLAVGRQWYGAQMGLDFAKNGLTFTLNILSATPHSSSIKALSMLGIGSANIIKVKSLGGNREAMCIDDLGKKLEALNGAPAILITSGGTVNTVDFDDFKGIFILQKKYNFWWHLDAAFGGFAACSDAYKHLLDGWENADSITIDCHKWLNVPYESAVFLIKQAHSKLQTEAFQNSNAPYLGNPFDNFNYLNFLPENSRRLKALPAWFSLQAYGKTGYTAIVENCIELAQNLGAGLDAHPAFNVLAPIRLNNICFTLTQYEAEAEVTTFLTKLNQTGKVFMTPTRYRGVQAIRCSIVNWRTSQKDVDLVMNLMDALVSENIKKA